MSNMLSEGDCGVLISNDTVRKEILIVDDEKNVLDFQKR